MVGSSGAFTVAAAWRPRSLSSKNLSKSWRFMAFQVSLKTSFIDFHWTFSVDLLICWHHTWPVSAISIHFHPFPAFQHGFRMPSAPHVRPASGFSRLKSFSEFPAGAWKVKGSKNINYRVELDSNYDCIMQFLRNLSGFNLERIMIIWENTEELSVQYEEHLMLDCLDLKHHTSGSQPILEC